MLRLLIALAAVGGLIYLIQRLRQASPEQRRRRLRQLLISAGALLLVGLAVSGRIHWLGALFGALLPLLQPLMAVLARELPERMKHHQARQGAPRGNNSGPMSRAEALAILGLEEGADRDAIVRAHRQLMQKLHPDRGGNHYLASQLNRAKERLLDAPDSTDQHR